jgi:SAM-dependent methyltransferase
MRASGTGKLADADRAFVFLQTALPDELRPVFDLSFLRSHVRYGEFVARLVVGIVREAGLDVALREPGSVADIAARAGLDAGQALVPLDWMLRFLAARRLIETLAGDTGASYVAGAPWPVLDPAPIREQQLRCTPTWMPAYVLAETVARDYPAFLRGEVTGEDVLFSPRRFRFWVEYFSNDNGLYVVNNRVAAAAAARWLPDGDGLVVLELGGGLASGALALLEQLEVSGRLTAIGTYRFTEPVAPFLRRGEQVLRARYSAWTGLTSASLDMNRPFAEQGVAPRSVSLVYAVNTVHAAHDLEFTLGEVRQALRPGGRLVLAECVRPREPIYAEFVFNLMQAFRSPRLHPRHRPHGGFLRPEHWTAALEAAGFEDVRFLPDIVRIHEAVPDFGVAAIGGTRPG